MRNKSIEVNDLLTKIGKEVIENYSIVDFWDADTTAIGLKIGEKLFYISTFNYSKILKYNIIIENYETGEILQKEKEVSYNELKNYLNISEI